MVNEMTETQAAEAAKQAILAELDQRRGGPVHIDLIIDKHSLHYEDVILAESRLESSGVIYVNRTIAGHVYTLRR